MPVLREIPVDLDMEQILRNQGIGEPDKVKPQFITTSLELLAIVQKKQLLEPALSYEIYTIAGIQQDQLRLDEGTIFHSRILSKLLASAQELCIAVCTIGQKLEDMSADYFKQNMPLKGTLLDGIGNAALDAVSQYTCQIISREAEVRGYKASSPLNPGMTGWPVSNQQELLRLAQAEKIGVRLTTTMTMVPLKSLSMVFGIGAGMKTWSQAEACKRCNLSKTCQYRVRT